MVWTSQKQYEYICDNELKSFIFQLNHDEKFSLKADKAQQAIRRDILYGPTFGGGCDIIIKENSNLNTDSFANIG